MAFGSSARICLVLVLMRFLRMACGALSACVVRPAPRGWDWPSRDSECVKPFVDGRRHAMLRTAPVSVLAVPSHSGPCGSRSAPRCTAVRRTVRDWAPLPHLHRDWAHPCHICIGTGLTPATSAPGLGSPLPHLHRDCGAARFAAEPSRTFGRPVRSSATRKG
jgi:hypothetical protein